MIHHTFKKEVNNLTGNNHDDLLLISMRAANYTHYNIDNPYSHQVFSVPSGVKDKLKLEVRLTAL